MNQNYLDNATLNKQGYEATTTDFALKHNLRYPTPTLNGNRI